MHLFIDTLDDSLEVNTLLDQHRDGVVSLLDLLGVLLPELLQLLLALQVLGVALLHVLVHSLQPLLVLRHAGVQVLFDLLLLLEDRIIIDLLYVFPFLIHLFLDIDDHRVLKPNAVVILILNQCISQLIAPDAT